MTGFDWVLVGLWGLFIIYGYIRGLIHQLVSIAGLFLAYWIALKGFPILAPLLQAWFPLADVPALSRVPLVDNKTIAGWLYNAIAFAALFAGVKLALGVVGYVLNVAAKIPGLNGLNRWSGALLAGVEAAAILALALEVMAWIPSEPVQSWLAHSQIAAWVHTEMPQVMDMWKPKA